MRRSTLRSMFRTLAAAAVLFVPVGSMTAFAQDTAPAGPAGQAPAPRTMLSPQQLENLVAPIALYPDPLLGQVLAASTYPLEIVEANQWLQQNRNLTGTALMDAAKQQNWDPSVQAMVAFPDVLSRLNSDVRWTTDLGNAFLGQQADVMGAVQRLRARAQANGKLKTTPQETVTDQTQNGQTQVEIQPADPQVIYVPTYDPAYIWGAPAWGYYPPLFYPTYGFGWGFGIPIGGFYFGWGGWGGYGWGLNWFGRGLYINGGFFGRYGYGGGFYGAHAGFAGNRAWSHDYARSSRATGTASYSRSYATAANRGAAGGAYRSAAAGGAARSSAAGSGYRSSAAGSSYRGGAAGATSNRANPGAAANRGYAGQSAARSYSASPSRSYSAPAARSYGSSGGSAGRSYSAPAHSSGGGGGGFHGGGGGGGSHGGGRR